jgi:uncharacterized membrane protein
MLNENLVSRLENWKFDSAETAADDDSVQLDDDQQSVISALSAVFGNVGHFHGDLSEIIRAAVNYVLGVQHGESYEEKVKSLLASDIQSGYGEARSDQMARDLQ